MLKVRKKISSFLELIKSKKSISLSDFCGTSKILSKGGKNCKRLIFVNGWLILDLFG